jgi:sigma-B regulation protein RsbU (phosphoserine phosphatase)
MCLFIILFLKFIRRAIVSPVNSLATAAANFASAGHEDDDPHLSTSAISDLNIHTGDEIESLFDAMKRMAGDIVAYIRNITVITIEKERIEAELNVASNIQTGMLPCIFPPFPDREEFDLHAMMIPAREVGGDFYDFFMIDADHLAAVIADVSGKGVPAALFMVITKTLIKDQLIVKHSPKEAFTEVNRQLSESNGESLFVTAWAGVLEISTGLLTFVNAGHNPPLISSADGGFDYVKTQPHLPLAIMPELCYKQFEMTLKKGDVLFLYTDGVTEASDDRKKMYETARLKEILDSSHVKSPIDLLPAVLEDVLSFTNGTPQSDDITMLGLRIKGRARIKRG